jgi:hypothetical protein
MVSAKDVVRTGDDWIGENGSLLASVVGIFMIALGAVLAWNRTPETALVWTGAILLAVGVLGDRVRSVELTRDGGSLGSAEKQKRLEPLIETAQATATAAPADFRLPIGGAYWAQPAVDAVRVAYGSTTRTDFDKAVAVLESQIANGTAVVQVRGADDALESLGEGVRAAVRRGTTSYGDTPD